MGYDYQIYQVLLRIETLLKNFFGSTEFMACLNKLDNIKAVLDSVNSYTHYLLLIVGVFVFLYIIYKFTFNRIHTY